HPSQPDPRRQRYRPECDPQSCALDAGGRNAETEGLLIAQVTGPPTSRPCPSPAGAGIQKFAPIRRADRRRAAMPRYMVALAGLRPARRITQALLRLNLPIHLLG